MAPMIDINLNDAIEFKPVPEGEYLLKIKEVEMTKSKNGGDMLELVFGVVEPTSVEGPDGTVKTADSSVWHRFNLRIIDEGGNYKEDSSRKSWGFLKEFIELIGVPINDSGGFDSDQFFNQTVWATVAAEEYQGRQSNNIKKFYQERSAAAPGGRSR